MVEEVISVTDENQSAVAQNEKLLPLPFRNKPSALISATFWKFAAGRQPQHSRMHPTMLKV